jgi:predicted Zn-dependent peptidase
MKRMEQTIVALIRPRLNLSQKESQAAHLVEHLLVASKRLQAIGISDDFYAKNVIFHGGRVNDFYMIEYYIVRQESADTLAQLLHQHQNELHTNSDDFKKTKSALVEELNENRGEFIGMGEQLSKAIYLPGSPTIRNPWNDLKSIRNLSVDKIEEIFHKYNTDITLIKLSFDNYKIDKIPTIERNRLCKSDSKIELTHPWQSPGCVETTHIIPFPTRIDFLLSTIYQRSLVDYRFGLLYDEIRYKQGLVYDISADMDYDSNTLEIYFSSEPDNSDIVTEHIKKTLGRYNKFIKKNLGYIKKRIKLDLELDWGDVQNHYLRIIETVVSGGHIETPAELINRLDQVTVNDIVELNKLFLNLFNNNAISTKHYHGKKVAIKKANK